MVNDVHPFFFFYQNALNKGAHYEGLLLRRSTFFTCSLAYVIISYSKSLFVLSTSDWLFCHFYTLVSDQTIMCCFSFNTLSTFWGFFNYCLFLYVLLDLFYFTLQLLHLLSTVKFFVHVCAVLTRVRSLTCVPTFNTCLRVRV